MITTTNIHEPSIYLLQLIQANANRIKQVENTLHGPLTPLQYMSLLNSSCDNLIKQSMNAAWRYVVMCSACLEQQQAKHQLLHIWQELMKQYDYEDSLQQLNLANRFINYKSGEGASRVVTEQQLAAFHRQLLLFSATLTQALDNYEMRHTQHLKQTFEFTRNLITRHPDFDKLNAAEKIVVESYIKHPPTLDVLKKIVPQPVTTDQAEQKAHTHLELAAAAAMATMQGLAHAKLPENQLEPMVKIAKIKDEIAVKQERLNKIERNIFILKQQLASSDQPNEKKYAQLVRQKTQYDLAQNHLLQYKKQHRETLSADRIQADMTNGTDVKAGVDPATLLATIKKNAGQFKELAQQQRANSAELLSNVKSSTTQLETLTKQLNTSELREKKP